MKYENITLTDWEAAESWFDPQSLDFMDWKLVKDGDHDRFEEHLFSIARNVVKDLDIFSSSKVIRAFWKGTKIEKSVPSI